MILAAGLGTRLGDLGKSKPKVLINIKGKTLLERHLDLLEAQGIERVVINTHHLYKQINSFVQQYDGPLEIIVVREEELLGTAGAVYHALPVLGPDPFIVIYGDTYIQPFKIWQLNGATTIAVHKADDSEGMGVVEIDQYDRVTNFVEKGTTGPALVNSGIYVLNHEIVDLLLETGDFGYDVFPQAIKEGIKIYAHVIPPVIDIGTPERLSFARW